MLLNSRKSVQSEFKFLVCVRGRNLGANSRFTLWNHGITEANDVNTLNEHCVRELCRQRGIANHYRTNGV